LLRLSLILLTLLFTEPVERSEVHPLRLSLCEIEYESDEQLLTVNLKLFLTDVNEAILFDPDNNELAFCTPNEPAKANQMLLAYLNQFFYVKANGNKLDLKVKRKRLSGEGDNVALWIYFEFKQTEPLTSLEIKNAVFTDLFFDQNNIVYIHNNGKSKSLMLNKKTPVHKLTY